MQSAGTWNTVVKTQEFLRVKRLPVVDCTENLEKKKTLLDTWLKTPTGTMSLWDSQVIALFEAMRMDGLFAPIPVGCGKALISLLLPTVLDSACAVLLVPAVLRDQTLKYVLPEMSKHWKISKSLIVMGYSELSLLYNRDILQRLKPDLIIMDECHAVSNLKSARTKRLIRYLRDHRDTRVAALSGTMTKKSLMDYWHLLQITLGPKNSPIPSKRWEAQDWADALDSYASKNRKKMDPGILRQLCINGESPREGYHRRLASTAGVVMQGKELLGTSLRILKKSCKVPEAVEAALDDLRSTWVLPNGRELILGLDIWRHARALALGFYYVWDPEPPDVWMDARTTWKKYVRQFLRYTRGTTDSELGVYLQSEHRPERQDWDAVREQYKINKKPIWIDDFAITEATKWLKTTTGICWVDSHVAWAERLAKVSKIDYFPAADDRILDVHGVPIIASTAHATGKNLQHYSKNLVVSPSSSNNAWEQLLGRTHRHGQKEDTVTVEVFSYTEEHTQAMRIALEQAQYVSKTMGSQQKLLYADLERTLL